ncbi:hypothetical protein [Ralstonia solanacearum]|uniref:hypothetical protein n=1 Tax=Ralstonia solanacearum TaxID=305 RepID=UPI0018D119F4|nr:hypothetical protein [Ralstonia solanacearum]
MKKIRFLFLVAAVTLLAACGQETPQLPGDAVQPQQSSGGGFLSSMGGAFAGSMLGNMLSRPAAPAYHTGPSPTVIVSRTTIIKKTVPAPAPAVKTPSYSPRPSASPSRSFSSSSSSFRSSPSRSFSGRR